ncbi:MAG TPA: cytochrome C oxidase subunit IV family protein [Pyrinomonadaceae bacterium]|nr:cytochrome C oxidase subunit IV family protein [Pyrinomonadaceae bacterium]
MNEAAVSIKTYALVFVTLLSLTATTFVVSGVDLGGLNAVAALVIAMVKALLVALFFMHLRYSRPLMLVVVAAGLLWLGIMITLTLGDFLTRGWLTYR